MAASLFLMPPRPILEGTLVSPGAQVFFTLAGTNTPSAPFTSITLDENHENPVIADATGRLPPIYLDDAVDYRVRIYLRGAAVGVDAPLEEYDPYTGFNGAMVEDAVSNTLLTGPGGILMVGGFQFGSLAAVTTAGGQLSVVFPEPFAHKPVVLVANGDSGAGRDNIVSPVHSSITVNGFTCTFVDSANALVASTARRVNWMAADLGIDVP